MSEWSCPGGTTGSRGECAWINSTTPCCPRTGDRRWRGGSTALDQGLRCRAIGWRFSCCSGRPVLPTGHRHPCQCTYLGVVHSRNGSRARRLGLADSTGHCHRWGPALAAQQARVRDRLGIARSYQHLVHRFGRSLGDKAIPDLRAACYGRTDRRIGAGVLCSIGPVVAGYDFRWRIGARVAARADANRVLCPGGFPAPAPDYGLAWSRAPTAMET